MPITSVTYKRKYPVGPFLNEEIGAEISLGENQDPLEALAEIAKLCNEFHAINNPHLSEPQPIQYSPPIGAVDKAPVEEPAESLVFLMEKCKAWSGPNGLNSYRLMKMTDQETEVFNRKKKEFGVIG